LAVFATPSKANDLRYQLAQVEDSLATHCLGMRRNLHDGDRYHEIFEHV
jgi:hypothetical protein